MRKILGTLALMVLSLMSLGLANAQTCPPGMVSYWKFDEGSGTTAGDSVNGNHGTIYGATVVDGKVGKALSFDGVDDYVSVPTIDGGSSYFNNGRFTLEAWVKETSRPRYDGVIVGGGWQYADFMLQTGSWWQEIDNFTLRIGENCWTFVSLLISNELHNLNEWYHVVGTHDDSTHENKLYVNGKLVASGSGSWCRRSGYPVYIGRNEGGSWFNGSIDEVAIYNRALTPEEIQLHYENSLNGLGYCELPTFSVEIDIKPGSYPNSINLKSEGVIPVAILTTESFDAAFVEGTTVTFGPGGAKPIHDEEHLEDVNNDDKLDWVGHFKTQETGIKDTDKEATITGKTKNGKDFTGKDSVNIVGGPKKAPALNQKHKLAMTWASIKSK